MSCSTVDRAMPSDRVQAWSNPTRHQVRYAAPAVAARRDSAIWLALTAVTATLRKWRQRGVARRELAELDSRILRDIGMDLGARADEVRRPFWHPHRNWCD